MAAPAWRMVAIGMSENIPAGARLLIAVMLWCVSAAAALAESVTLERDSALYSEPRVESAVLANLVKGTAGTAISRQGAWVQVRSGQSTGWLYSFNVRFGSVSGSGDSGGSVLGRVFGPRQRVSVTSTIGIRGLDTEDLKQAQFDGGQLQQMDGFAVSREQAQAYAGETGLNAAAIEYLQEPAAAEGMPR